MTQCEQVIEYIKKYGSISSWEAIEKLRITRLSGRINELRERGYDIETIMVKSKNGKYYGRYMLKKDV